MTQLLEFEPTNKVRRQFAAKLGNTVVVVPAMKWITDTAGSAGSMNVINGPIPAPDAAPTAASSGAGVVDGAVQYRITFYNNNTGAEGPPSAAVSFTASTDTVRVTYADTNEAANTTVTHRRIYRTAAGGSDFYPVAIDAVANNFYDDNIADTTITALSADILDTSFAAPAADTYGIIREHNSYLFMGGPYNQAGGTAYDHKIAWCKVGNPDQWSTFETSQINFGQYGIIRALSRSGDTLVIFKDSCIAEYTFSDNPSRQYGNATCKTVNSERGTLNQRTVVEIQGVNYVMDYRGIYIYAGGTQIIEVSGPLKDFWERINWAQRDRFCAVRSNDRIWFFVALDGASTVNWAFVYSLKAARSGRGTRWWVERYDHDIRDCCEVETGRESATTTLEYGRQTVPMVMTASGHTFILNSGYRDGVAPRLTAFSNNFASSSTTVTPVSGTYSTTGGGGDTVDVRGCWVWFRDGNDNFIPGFESAYLITGVSGSVLTVAGMPSDPVTAGATRMYIGGLPKTEYRTGWNNFGSPKVRARAGKLHIGYQVPGAITSIRIQHTRDRLAPRSIRSDNVEENYVYAATAGLEYMVARLGGPNDGTLTSGLSYDRKGQIMLPADMSGAQLFQTTIFAEGIDMTVVIDRIELDVLATFVQGGASA